MNLNDFRVQVPTIFFENDLSSYGGLYLNGRSEQNQGTTTWKFLGDNTWKYKKVKAIKLQDGSFNLKINPPKESIGKITLKIGKVVSRIEYSDITQGHYARIGKCAVDLMALKEPAKVPVNEELEEDLDADELDIFLQPGRYMTDQELKDGASIPHMPDPYAEANDAFISLLDSGALEYRNLTDEEVKQIQVEKGLQHISPSQIRAEYLRLEYKDQNQ